jgi:hypothetical protein
VARFQRIQYQLGGVGMIQNDIDLKATQEKIIWFESRVAQFHIAEMSPAEFELISSSYLAVIEKMHAEVIEYLGKYDNEIESVETA